MVTGIFLPLSFRDRLCWASTSGASPFSGHPLWICDRLPAAGLGMALGSSGGMFRRMRWL
jgi:hypothetical protein